MARRRTFRQLLLGFLAYWSDVSLKQIAARLGVTESSVSQLLRRKRTREIKEEDFENILAVIPHKPAEVWVLTECIEAMEALDETEGLTDEQVAGVELEVLRASRLMREDLRAALRRASALTFTSYPEAADLTPARLLAEEQWERLKGLTPELQSAVVRGSERFQSFALCEKVCDLSEEAAARDLKEAAARAGLAREIADLVQGPEGWCNALKGYATGPGANVLRVAGEIKAARTTLEEAKRLWKAGSDREGVLDPGRLLDLEASLCRDERRFGEALAFLDQAIWVTHKPERVLIKKGFTLEVMGEYERAAELLLHAISRIDRHSEPHLWNIARLNLANNLCHLGRYKDAAELVKAVRPLVVKRGDKIDLIRLEWLEARLAAAVGFPDEALQRLEQVRKQFAEQDMSYEVALALLEEAVLLLDQGRISEVKALAGRLEEVFAFKGMHQETLVALRLFQEAAQHEEATVDLARRILRYLYRARYDAGLPFKAS
jgi:tetratricopeptide (TPR) repeat protein